MRRHDPHGTNRQDSAESAASRLAARVDREQIEDALRGAIRALEKSDDGHYGYAHPKGEPFVYRPDTCPGCRISVLRALADKEVLYV